MSRIRLSAWVSAVIVALIVSACEKHEEGLPRETQDRLTVISQSLTGIESTVTKIQKQNEEIRERQRTCAGSLDTLRVQAETLNSELDALQTSSSTTSQQIRDLKLAVTDLRQELGLLIAGEEPAPVKEQPSNRLQLILAITGAILLTALLLGFGFFLLFRRRKRLEPMAPAAAPIGMTEVTAVTEEPPREEHTDLGAIRFYGSAKMEHEKQSQTIAVKPSQVQIQPDEITEPARPEGSATQEDQP